MKPFASNLPVESPVGVLAATDRPYSVAVPHHRLADVDERPTWRGRTHLWAFGVALPATVVLVAGAHPGRLNVTSYVMYPALGWVSVVAMPILVRHLSAAQLALILAGGLAYTVGMVVLWRRWPDPRPRRFGYHEVWHLFTIVAAALHFAAVASVVR